MDNPDCKKRIVAADGSHLTMEGDLINKKYGLLIPKTKDGRVLFILPWLDHAILGTTDH